MKMSALRLTELIGADGPEIRDFELTQKNAIQPLVKAEKL